MPNPMIWVFYNKRTNPARIHRFTENGEPSAVVIHVLKEGATDGVSKTVVEDVPMTGAGNTPALTHLPEDWQSADWSNHQWPRGTLFVWQDEYPDPHAVFAEAQRKRLAAEAGANPPPVEEHVEGPSPEPAPSSGPRSEPQPQPSTSEIHPADTNADHVISKAEKQAWNAEHPDSPVEKGPY